MKKNGGNWDSGFDAGLIFFREHLMAEAGFKWGDGLEGPAKDMRANARSIYAKGVDALKTRNFDVPGRAKPK